MLEKQSIRVRVLLIAFAIVGTAALPYAQSRRGYAKYSAANDTTAALNAGQSSTDDRRDGPGWWPTKETTSRSEYTGPETCVSCHIEKSSTLKSTPMAVAGRKASDSPILRAHAKMSVHLGPYDYAITRDEHGSVATTSDGTHTISDRLGWAFGEGEVGESYILERKGKFYEARISYYTKLDGLDFSPGRQVAPSDALLDASGILMSETEARHCFGCHNTAPTVNNRFQPYGLISGVTCEACHGPGLKHVTAMRRHDFAAGTKAIFNPAKLRPTDSVDFCGACHRSWWDTTLSGTFGIANLRFQPYRLENSKCWQRSQGRLTCLVCHDPHQPLQHAAGDYDSACFACHATSKATAVPASSTQHLARACPVATKDCSNCHMPKYPVPGMHFDFTDHDIRVVRAGAPYPP